MEDTEIKEWFEANPDKVYTIKGNAVLSVKAVIESKENGLYDILVRVIQSQFDLNEKDAQTVVDMKIEKAKKRQAETLERFIREGKIKPKNESTRT